MGFVGGMLIPLAILTVFTQFGTTSGGSWELVSITFVWLGCLTGELFERYLFFAAVSSPRMPGGVRP